MGTLHGPKSNNFKNPACVATIEPSGQCTWNYAGATVQPARCIFSENSVNILNDRGDRMNLAYRDGKLDGSFEHSLGLIVQLTLNK
jgi:hypothetical protein